MKKIIWFSGIAILLVAGIILYNYYQRYFLVDADYSEALALLKKEIDKQKPAGKTYKYHYYNLWNLKCGPCISEMPELDSIAENLPDNIEFVFVSNDKEKDVNAFLERKKLNIRHFIYVNDMNYFMSAVYKKVNNTNVGYPTHVITDSLDHIIFFSQGTLTKLYDIDALKISEKDKKLFKESLKDRVIKKLESLH